MKTGIIIYSQTGHTRQAAQRLRDALRNKGQECELLEVQVSNPKPETSIDKLEFTVKPSPEGYDRLVFASPVWAFSLCGVMKAYMAGLPSLGGKKISLFVTHHLPLPWMGGNNAIKQMKQLCLDKGGQVQSHAIISWNERRREVDIAGMLNRLA